MEKIKKNWKTILIGLLVIFSLNRCTVACNRDTKVNKQQVELKQQDSIIKSQKDSLNILKIRWDDSQRSQNTYQEIAIGNQNELVNTIIELKNENSIKDAKINSLVNENTQLKKEYTKLKRENSSLKNMLKTINNII